MKIWFYGIPEGEYTIEKLIAIAKMDFTRNNYYKVYNSLRSLAVKNKKPKFNEVDENGKKYYPNTKIWLWKGYQYYLTHDNGISKSV